MERLALLPATAIIAACSAASEPVSPPVSCVQATSCGCSLIVSGSTCPNGGVHFFHELADGSPLQFDLGRGSITATAERPRTNVFSHGPGESWTESYRYNGGRIEIRYSPGPNKCPKLAQGGECEYFDVRARVLISGPQGMQGYSGVGACGC